MSERDKLELALYRLFSNHAEGKTKLNDTVSKTLNQVDIYVEFAIAQYHARHQEGRQDRT